MKLPNLSRFAPPGANWDLFARIALWFPLVSAGISLIIFASWLSNAVITAKAGYIIYDSWDDLWVLPRYTFSFFWLSALCLLAFAIYFFSFFYQGSKSVYLMRRLPKRGEMAIRSLTLPIAGALFCLLSALLLRLIFHAVYLLIVPDNLLPAEPWQVFWR